LKVARWQIWSGIFAFAAAATLGILWFKVIRYTLPRPLPVGQCTWYAAERAAESGWKINFRQQFGRDAKNWAALVSNATIENFPTPGSLLVLDAWPGNPYGHVAYVESVSEPNKITITHCNMSAGEEIAERQGATVRKCEVNLTGNFAQFNGSKSKFKVIGFLKRN